MATGYDPIETGLGYRTLSRVALFNFVCPILHRRNGYRKVAWGSESFLPAKPELRLSRF